jgi:tetratricopeptide (TPR) repeat protein
MNVPSSPALVLAGAIAAFAGAVALQVARDRTYPRELRDTERMLYVRSGPAMQRIALSYDALAADVYWIRAVQHFGGDRLADAPGRRKYELLHPLLDLATSLDPYFNIAYRFGAIFLSEPYPGGAGRPDQAVALLRKGIAATPQRWQYYHDTAFVYYWRLGDHAAAAQWFQRAAAQPGAPGWLAPLAASVLARGGDRASARFLWQQMLSSEQEWVRRTAGRSLQQLDAMDRIDSLEAVVRRAPPPPDGRHSWLDLARRGVLPGIPVDPAGTPLEIDAVTGEITVSPRSPLYPMPAHEWRAGT